VTEIRSFRTVFDLERRIYRIDRLRLNPSGIPLRGVAYFLASVAAALLAARLPLVGLLAQATPWYLREVAFPGALAALLALIRIEGRPFHLAALAVLRYACRARELAGLRPRCSRDRRLRPGELIALADGSDARLRRLRYRGPGAVRIGVAHVRCVSRRGVPRVCERAHARHPSVRISHSVRIAPLPGARRAVVGQVIELAPGARLEVRSRPWRSRSPSPRRSRSTSSRRSRSSSP
jgi:hypothetical protein